jgi:hypothetical protein
MRKVLMLLTLTLSSFAFSAAVNADPPPQCSPNCPFIR